MSNLLEKIFREKLKDYDAGISGEAWQSFEQRLDASASKATTLKKLLWTAAAIAVLTPVVYFSLSSSSTSDEVAVNEQPMRVKGAVESKTTEESEVLPDENNISSNQEKDQVLKIKDDKNPDKNDNTQVSNSDVADETMDNVSRSQDQPEENIDEQQPSAELPQEKQGKNVPNEEKTPMQKSFVPGEISETLICQGESVKVKNTSDDELVIVRVEINGLVVDLTVGKKLELKLDETTEVLFLNSKNQPINAQTISVLKSDIPVSNVVANIYERGLPVTEVQLIGTIEEANWYFDGRSVGHGQEQIITTFNKGRHKIHVDGLDANGCPFNIEIPVRIEKDYDLIAPTSLDPDGTDSRRRTFMPHALKERETPFTMYIIDPRDNEVIYTTRDANEPWDGIDRRTGQLVTKDRPFIWKVQLDAAVEGEKNVYIGNVMLY